MGDLSEDDVLKYRQEGRLDIYLRFHLMIPLRFLFPKTDLECIPQEIP